MIKLRITILICILFQGVNLDAQIQKGFEALHEYDFFKARKIFLKAQKKQPAPAHFGLAKIHYDRLNHFHQLDSAYKHIKTSIFALNLLNEKQKLKLITYGLTDSSAQNLLDSIYYQAFIRANKQSQTEAYQHFLNEFGENMYRKKVIFLRDSSVLASATLRNTPEEFEKFLQAYPESELKPIALKKLDKIRYELVAQENTISAYNEFIKDYPNSQFRNEAEDGIFKLMVLNGTQDELIRFVREFPNNRNTMRCWDQFYANYVADQSTERIMEFKEKFPDYPFLDKLNRDFNLSKTFFFPVVKNELWGYVDTNGVVQIPYQFEEAEYFYDNFAVVRKNGKYGYINKSGFITISCTFKDAESFDKGLAIVETDSGVGLINAKGNWIAQPQYYSISKNACGLYRVEKNDLYGLMDIEGKIIQEIQFEDIGDCSENRIGFVQNGQAGFMDETGRVIIEPRFEEATGFQSDIARVSIDEKMAAIKSDGLFILPPKFNKISPASDGLILAEEDKKCFVYSISGKKVANLTDRCAPPVNGIDGYHKGLARVEKKGKYGFIDRKGKIVIPTIYDQTGSFSDELCPVKIKGKWGYINKSGKMVIEPQFEMAYAFNNQIAKVRKNGKVGIINMDGKFHFPCEYDDIQEINELFIVELGGLKGLYAKDKSTITPIIYQEIKPTLNTNVLEMLANDRMAYFHLKLNRIFWTEEEIADPESIRE